MDRSLLAIVSAVLAILLGIIIAWWPHYAQALALEDSPFAWVQSSLLAASATLLALRATFAAPRASRRDAWVWGALALLVLLAALDERFMGHERIQEWIVWNVLHGDPTLKPLARAVIALYGVAGVGALWWMKRAMHAGAWRWCRAGVLVGLGAIALDLAFDSVNVQVIEELLEAAAETLFLCGLFRELRTAASPHC